MNAAAECLSKEGQACENVSVSWSTSFVRSGTGQPLTLPLSQNNRGREMLSAHAGSQCSATKDTHENRLPELFHKVKRIVECI